MAIVTENHFEYDGRIFKRTYSDAGFVIEQVETGFRFAEALDMHDATYTYVETTDPINSWENYIEDPEPSHLDYTAEDLVLAARILLGEDE